MRVCICMSVCLSVCQLFEPLLRERPEAFSKVQALAGHTSRENMALSPEDQRVVQDNVSVVFHLAAALDWRASLKKATAENVSGTKMVLDFCKGIKNLVVSSILGPTRKKKKSLPRDEHIQ